VIVQKRPKAEAIEGARRLLEQVGLGQKADQNPYQRSGGLRSIVTARTQWRRAVSRSMCVSFSGLRTA
jgi:ABC-type polar amino acid transport system ATPase subunit